MEKKINFAAIAVAVCVGYVLPYFLIVMSYSNVVGSAETVEIEKWRNLFWGVIIFGIAGPFAGGFTVSKMNPKNRPLLHATATGAIGWFLMQSMWGVGFFTGLLVGAFMVFASISGATVQAKL
jgi:hypothetical protein